MDTTTQTHSAENHLDRVKDKAQDTADEALRQGRELASQAQDAAKDALTGIEARIRRNPIQSALVAAGAGFVLAMLARR
jgi:ElaB/YqjD/DUF883 family membrane-anchored ribosome-binding protein